MNDRYAALKALIPREHGAYIVLIASVCTGIGRARMFTADSVIAILTVGFAYLSHAPLQRWYKSRRHADAVSGALLLGVAGICALPLFFSLRFFWGFVVGEALIYLFSSWMNWNKQKRSIANEFIVFCGFCMTSPLMYYASLRHLDNIAFTLWLFNLANFGSTIFSVKIRLHGKAYILPTVIYMMIAALTLCAIAYIGVFPWQLLLAFVPLLLKISFYSLRPEWFRSARLQTIGVIETFAAAAFAALVIFL
ncbi:MAG TPA: YwiC-like family protein [Candidatus Kapabacteria bacterium]|nr:YwiC-like family protein [Candidatus Kapabacteria bacterium]